MKLKRVTEATGKVSAPLNSLNRGGGWVTIEPTEPGLLISLSPGENGGVFISDVELNKLGYHFRRPPKKREKMKEGDKRTYAKKKAKKRR